MVSIVMKIFEKIYFEEVFEVDELIVIDCHRHYEYLLVVDEKRRNVQLSDDDVE
jgi:hypothetical protein